MVEFGFLRDDDSGSINTYRLLKLKYLALEVQRYGSRLGAAFEDIRLGILGLTYK
jgi:hypothetical protein